VCISRTVGAGGEEIGQLVAERLGFRHIDEEIVARAAQKSGLDPADVADTERRHSFVQRLLEGASSGGSVETYTFGGFVAAAGSEDLRGVIREAIEEAAAQGEVVIVAHAASFALADRDDVLRTFVTASPAVRAERLGKHQGLDEKDATKAVKDSDSGRADYLKRFYEIDHESPVHYDLVVSTDALGVDQAAEIVARAAQS
jgi:cytidylate kinase